MHTELIMDNPKAAFGRRKIEVSNTTEISLLYLAATHDLGAVKYGPYNWRDIPIKGRITSTRSAGT